MCRSLLAILSAAMLVLLAQAQDKPEIKDDPKSKKPDRKGQIEEAAITQDHLKRQLDEWKQTLLRLALRLESSDRAEDKEKAKKLKDIEVKSAEMGTASKFSALVAGLKQDKAAQDLDNLSNCLERCQDVTKDLQLLLEMLLPSDDAPKLPKRIEGLNSQVKQLDKVLARQKQVRDRLADGKVEGAQLVEELSATTTEIQEALRSLNKEDKKGAGPAVKLLEEAVVEQQKAAESAKKADREKSLSHQADAIAKVVSARKTLDDTVELLRDERREYGVSNLKSRCEQLLARQMKIQDETKKLNQAIAANSDKKPTRADVQAALRLSDQQNEANRLAEKVVAILEILDAENEAPVAFKAFKELSAQMRANETLLRKTEVGEATQKQGQEVVSTLTKMADDLKKQHNKFAPPELDKAKSQLIRTVQKVGMYLEKWGAQLSDPDVELALERADEYTRQGIADYRAGLKELETKGILSPKKVRRVELAVIEPLDKIVQEEFSQAKEGLAKYRAALESKEEDRVKKQEKIEAAKRSAEKSYSLLLERLKESFQERSDLIKLTDDLRGIIDAEEKQHRLLKQVYSELEKSILDDPIKPE